MCVVTLSDHQVRFRRHLKCTYQKDVAPRAEVGSPSALWVSSDRARAVGSVPGPVEGRYEDGQQPALTSVRFSATLQDCRVNAVIYFKS